MYALTPALAILWGLLYWSPVADEPRLVLAKFDQLDDCVEQRIFMKDNEYGTSTCSNIQWLVSYLSAPHGDPDVPVQVWFNPDWGAVIDVPSPD